MQKQRSFPKQVSDIVPGVPSPPASLTQSAEPTENLYEGLTACTAVGIPYAALSCLFLFFSDRKGECSSWSGFVWQGGCGPSSVRNRYLSGFFVEPALPGTGVISGLEEELGGFLHKWSSSLPNYREVFIPCRVGLCCLDKIDVNIQVSWRNYQEEKENLCFGQDGETGPWGVMATVWSLAPLHCDPQPGRFASLLRANSPPGCSLSE